jgi:hypothetical protein
LGAHDDARAIAYRAFIDEIDRTRTEPDELPPTRWRSHTRRAERPDRTRAI